MNWHEKTLSELSQAIFAKEVSSVELTQYFLQRISQYQGLNAYLDVQEDLSLRDAHFADELIAKGHAGPLTGIPVAHKDVFVKRLEINSSV